MVGRGVYRRVSCWVGNFYPESSGPAAGQPAILETGFGRQKELVYWAQENSPFAHWQSTYNYNDIRNGPEVVELVDGDIWLQTAPGASLQALSKNYTDIMYYGNATE